jgi:MoaA/NifB/PqqE/SkfB family radical SAM enzyme
LLQLAKLLLDRLPALRRVTITTNALNTERVVRQCADLLQLCAMRGVGLFAGVSLDGVGQVHDEMRNIPQAFVKVQNTVQELQSLQTRGLRLGISCTLTSRNLHDAENVRRWAEERGLPVNYIVASFADSYYDNTECAEDLSIRPDQQGELLSLLRQLGARKSPGNPAAYFYADAAAMVERAAPRTTPCIFQKDGFILDARGDLQYCMYSQVLGNVRHKGAAELFYAPQNLAHRRQLIADKCGKCTITCFLELGLAKDALRYAGFLLGGRP